MNNVTVIVQEDDQVTEYQLASNEPNPEDRLSPEELVMKIYTGMIYRRAQTHLPAESA